MKLADIQAQPNGVMSIDERVHIRRILGVSESVTDTYNDQSETTFIEISKRVIADGISVDQETKNIFRCKELRALYKAYDLLGDGNLMIDGGRDGIKISASEDRLYLAVQLWKRVIPHSNPVPNEDVFSRIDALEKTSSSTDNGTFSSVPVSFNDINRYNDEYNG